MRIALVSQEYPPETAKGGIGSQTFLKAHGLMSRGHEVYVISRCLKGEPSKHEVLGVPVIRVSGWEKRMALHTEVVDWLTYSGEVAAALAALHAATPVDLVDFPEWAAEGYVHLLNRTAWNRFPAVIQLHGPLVMFAHTMGWPEINSEFFRSGTAMEGTCLRLADAVYSSSRCSADWCAKHYSLERESIPIIHTGVDVNHFRARPVPKAERPTVIFVGKLTRNKGVPLLVEAACQLAREFPGLHLRLLGSGDPNLIEAWKLQARAAGFEKLLDFPGFIDRADLPEHLSSAHLFAAPSQYEGGPGLVYLESMACGLPVIACAGSGAAEVIRDGENGLLVAPQEVKSLTNALRSLLRDRTKAAAMGKQAREFVLKEANSQICLAKLEAFYSAVVKVHKTATTAL